MNHVKAKDALDTLGTILTKDEGRDAVHLAVCCCRAAARIQPGDRVCLYGEPKDGLPISVMCRGNMPKAPVFGIADPFLDKPYGIDVGDYFWVLLTPRTITSLKHVWTHPAFPEETE